MHVTVRCVCLCARLRSGKKKQISRDATWIFRGFNLDEGERNEEYFYASWKSGRQVGTAADDNSVSLLWRCRAMKISSSKKFCVTYRIASLAIPSNRGRDLKTRFLGDIYRSMAASCFGDFDTQQEEEEEDEEGEICCVYRFSRNVL